jgi:hypothetical protein
MSETDELCSWKEIAAYLGVTVRTAQKWEHERGLAVRHLPGSRRGRVLITIGELDAWKQSSTVPATGTAPALKRHVAWRWFVPLAVVMLLALIAVLAWPRAGAPARFRIEHNALVVTDDHGRDLWRKTFDALHPAAYATGDKVWFGDLDAAGETAVLFLLISGKTGAPAPLIAYNKDGSERWRFVPGRAVRTATGHFAPPFRAEHFLVAPLGRDGSRRIAVTSTHLYYACQIALLDTNGHLLREYWHSGHLQHLLAADLQQQGWNALVIAGINNARKAATLLVLDPDHFTGASREELPEYQLQDFPPPVEAARLLFPRSCINRALEPFVDITALWRDGADLALEVQHRLSPPDATLFYRLKPDLTLDSVAVGASFERVHLALHASGILKHTLSPSEITGFQQLTYVTGGPTRSTITP